MEFNLQFHYDVLTLSSHQCSNAKLLICQCFACISTLLQPFRLHGTVKDPAATLRHVPVRHTSEWECGDRIGEVTLSSAHKSFLIIRYSTRNHHVAFSETENHR